MKEEKKSKTIWNSKRGKAFIKLCLWFFFLLFVATSLMISDSTQKRNQKKDPISEKIEFTEFHIMWKNLEETDFSYQYKILDKIKNEQITYEGKIENGIDIGCRNSKIGMIRYKKEGENVYQLNDNEEKLIENLYDEEDSKYVVLSHLKKYFNVLTMTEEIQENNKIIQYLNEEESIIIKTNSEKILFIQINTNEKEYHLFYDY